MLKDSDWVKKSFLGFGQLPHQKLSVDAAAARTFADPQFKFTDTLPGSNFSLNNPPSSNALADPVIKGRIPGTTKGFNSSAGMGLKWSDHVDDSSELLYMRFGHPSFSGLTTFFNEFFNYEASVMARTGRTPGFMYSLGKALGFVTMIPFMPYIALGYVSNLAYQAITGGYKSSKFMTLKPNMYGFWGSVGWMFNSLGVNMNLVWPYAPENLTPIEEATRNKLVNQYPGIIDSTGLVDIFRLVLRGQRQANKYRDSVKELIEANDNINSFRDGLRELSGSQVNTSGTDLTYSQYLTAYQKLDGTTMSGDPKLDDNLNMEADKQSWWSEFKENTVAGINDGADWLVLRVKHKKDWTMTVNNSTKDNPITDKFNSVSQQSKDTSFMFAGGSLGDGPLASALEGVLGGVKDVVTGVADSYGIGGIAALGGAALVDIQQIHGDSSFDLPSSDYEIDLDTPSGDKWSEYLHIMPTVCALLAGSLPISTGKHSYDSPYYCEAYMKGKTQIREGIITNLSITRGRNNIGWTRDGRARGYTVSFTISNLSNVLHMPMNPQSKIWDGDTAFSDLLAVLGSVSLDQQLYAIPRLNLKMANMKADIQQAFSPSKMALSFADSMTGRMARIVARGTDSLSN